MLAKRIFGFRVVLGLPAGRCFMQNYVLSVKIGGGWSCLDLGELPWCVHCLFVVFSIGAARSVECRLRGVMSW